MKIPTFLYQTLLNQRDEASIREENCENYLVNCKKQIDGKYVSMNNTYMMDFSNTYLVLRTLETDLFNILEDFSKVKLNPNGVIYGIRRYTHGSILLEHVDKTPSHIISAILQID